MTDGVIYVAKGPGYLNLVERSERSLRSVNPEVAVDLFADQPVTRGLFNQRRPPPEGQTPKLACLTGTRYDRALCLDCDTLMPASPADLFDKPGQYETAVARSRAASQAADVRGMAAKNGLRKGRFRFSLSLTRPRKGQSGMVFPLAIEQRDKEIDARSANSVRIRDLPDFVLTTEWSSSWSQY